MVEIQLVSIKKLTLLKNNPRTITKDQMDKLCESLKNDPDFFHNRPVLVHQVDDALNVYAGNQRILAAKKLGWKEVPCIIEMNLSNEIIKKRIVKDNNHAGEWDYDILANEYDIETLIDCGFTPDKLHISDIEELEEKEEKSSKKKLKMCPSCGYEM